MWFGASEDEARQLEARAIAHLEAGAHDAALALAEDLVAMRWSGGFEIKALSLAARGAPEEAVELLEVAVERAPDAWRLWHLLGTLRSDLGRLDGALAALDRALAAEGAGEIPIRYNRAVARHRRGEPGKALADLEPILALPRPPGPIAEDVLALAAECLAEIGRAEDALTMVADALSRCAEDDPRRARLHAEHALALHRAGDEPGAQGAFRRATAAGVATPSLLALGRRWLAPRTHRTVRFQLVVQGAAPPERTDAEGFFRVFDVVAENPDDAFELARAFVLESARPTLRVERCEVREDDPTLERGVHGASELLWFAE